MKKIALLSFLLAGLAWSQLTIETTTTSDGFLGQGAFESTSKTMIQGEMKRDESQLRFTGSIMKHMNKKGMDIQITRLDREVIWSYNDQDKKYTELTFAEMKSQVEKGMQGQGYPGMETDPETSKSDDGEYEWQDPVIEVTELGREAISGVDCKHHVITVTTVGKHKATGILDTLLLKSDIWHSKEYGQALEIQKTFNQRLMESMGVGRETDMGLAQLAKMYGEQMAGYADELKKLDGLPMKTVFRMSSTQNAMAKGESDESVEEEESSEQSVTDLRKGLGGMFGKKVAQMAKSKVQKEKAQSGPKTILSTTSLVTAIDVGEIQPALFEVPTGYKIDKK